MGLSLGGSKQSSTGSSTSTPTYSGTQSGIQSLLAGVLGTLVPSMATGAISPNVAGTEASGADQINKTYTALGDRMNKFLASRGMGQSGVSGKAQLDTELGRAGAIAGNTNAAAGNQLGLNSSLLSDALMFAFANPGSSSAGQQSGSSSNWGASGALSFGL